MSADPRAEPLDLPAAYGAPQTTLAWAEVRERLVCAPHYWLASVRPDGRPHVVPLDGIWHDDRWYFGGSPQAVKHRNLQADPRAVLHLEDARRAVIVEGACELVRPDADLAAVLAQATQAKYGYPVDPASYAEQEIWCLRPQRALSWQRFPRDATRFVFDWR